jgi:hypothetical protein
MKAPNVLNIDTGATIYGKLSEIKLDTIKVFQTDVAGEMYPNEQGQNNNEV